MASKHAQQRRPSTQFPQYAFLHQGTDSHPHNDSSYLLHREGIGIRLAPRQDDVGEVVRLLARMYEQRGYRIPSFAIEPHDRYCQITLEACRDEATTGTITVALDSTGRLKAEELYESEIASFRARGARVCEFIRLAVDTECHAKQTLAYLFHLAVIFAYRIHGATDLFIEVNPRHTLFYRRKLGFVQIGQEKICARVNAPAVLLHRSLSDLAKDVRKFGGIRSSENNTFYALWLTHAEENEMVRKIEQRIAGSEALCSPRYSGEGTSVSLAHSA